MRRICIGAVLLLAFSAQVRADDPKIVATRGGIDLPVSAVEQRIEVAPEGIRPALVESPERLATIIDELLVAEQILSYARTEGFDQRADVQEEIATAVRGILIRKSLEIIATDGKGMPDFRLMARERYQSDPSIGVFKGGKRVRHLLVSTESVSEADALKQATALLERARAGEDFGSLVDRYSEDPSKSSNGGVFVVSREGLFDPAFLNASLALEGEGTISDPVRSQFGFHLIQLLGEMGDGRQPFEAVEAELVASLRQEWWNAARERAIGKFRGLPIEYHEQGVMYIKDKYRSPAAED